MNNRIEELKRKLNDALEDKADWKLPYKDLIREIYSQKALFFALSSQEYDSERKTSIPLVSTKDFNGMPSLYIFSDVSIAGTWMRQYRHYSEDLTVGFIGAVDKEPHDFLSIFKIAAAIGVEMIMLDEGGTYVGIRMTDFIRENNLDMREIEVIASEEEIQDIIGNGTKPQLHLPRVDAIPLRK